MTIKPNSGKMSLALAFTLAAAVPLVAQADVITLEMTGVPGDSKFAANNGLPAGAIRVLTVGSSAENPSLTVGGTAGGAGTGKVNFSRLTVVKKFGESSAPLLIKLANGQNIPTAVVSFYRIKQGLPVRYYTITLQSVTVAAQKWLGNSGGVDSLDSESLELVYSRITLQDNENGGVATCYDVDRRGPC